MAATRERRDNALIDAIEEIEPASYNGNVWRVVREGRDPTQCSRSGGRWDDSTFDVLYTSEENQGAIEEMRFHLMRGQPIIPSKVSYNIFELEVSLERSLKLLDLAALQLLRMDTARYGQLYYEERTLEYPRSQDIGEVAHFLDYDGLVVPCARHDCMNVVVFCDQIPPDALSTFKDHGQVNW